MLRHPCILGEPQQRGTKSEVAAPSLPCGGPKGGRKCYVIPTFSGVLGGFLRSLSESVKKNRVLGKVLHHPLRGALLPPLLLRGCRKALATGGGGEEEGQRPPANPSGPKPKPQTNLTNNPEPEPNPTTPTSPLAKEENRGDPAKGAQQRVRARKRTHPPKMAVNKTKKQFQSMLHVLFCVFVFSWDRSTSEFLFGG